MRSIFYRIKASTKRKESKALVGMLRVLSTKIDHMFYNGGHLNSVTHMLSRPHPYPGDRCHCQ